MRQRPDPGTPDPSDVRVILGVDTHAEVHVAVALDQLGRRLGSCGFPATADGYADRLGRPARARGAGGHRGHRQLGGRAGAVAAGAGRARRRGRAADLPHARRGKSDPIDAEAAAQAVLAGTATGRPKSGDGPVEMVRALQGARRSALRARTQAANQLHALVVTAPAPLRERLRGLSLRKRVATAAAFRSRATLGTPTAATKLALRCVARRYQQLSAEIEALDAHLTRLVARVAPALLAVKGVGTDTAAVLLAAAGDNPDRLRSEAAFAHLCGVAPIPASSGKTVRHRLNRGGNRDANRALHLLAVRRLAWGPRTRAYAARRTAQGKTKPEILRCLKCYPARDLYPLLAGPEASPAQAPPPAP